MPSQSLNQCWNIVNLTLGNKLPWNVNLNSYIFIQENLFENVVRKMAIILSRPQCMVKVGIHILKGLDATRLLWWQVNIRSGDKLVPLGNKQPPEPMLAKFYEAVWLPIKSSSMGFVGNTAGCPFGRPSILLFVHQSTFKIASINITNGYYQI